MTDTPPISLKSLLTPSKTVAVDFPGYTGFTVDLCHLAKDEMAKIRKKCVTTKFDKRTHQPVEELNEEVFINLYCKAVIKGWSGFKFKYLEEFLLVELGDLDPEGEFPYSQENAETLMTNSNVFDTWVTENVGDLENFTSSK